MSNAEVKVFITPLRDTDNTHPHEIEFTLTDEACVWIDVCGRQLEFKLGDMQKLVKLANAVMEGCEMKYEYMKEYPTNGEKPDLPDDVLVDVLFENHWHPSIRVDKLCWNHKDTSYPIKAFRIADKCYKPKAEPLGNSEQLDSLMSKRGPEISKECLNHIPDGGKMADNSWHETGDLPPVGESCEVKEIGKKYITQWLKCTVLFTGENLIVLRHINGNEYSAQIDECEFRPIRSEREKFIEAATTVFITEATASAWLKRYTTQAVDSPPTNPYAPQPQYRPPQ